jgi:hypothetical protein
MNFDKPGKDHEQSKAIAALQRLRAARTKDPSPLPTTSTTSTIPNHGQTEELLKRIESSINSLLQGVEALCQWEKRKDEQSTKQGQYMEKIELSLAAIAEYFTEQERILEQEDTEVEELPQESVVKMPQRTFLVPTLLEDSVVGKDSRQLSLEDLTEEAQ